MGSDPVKAAYEDKDMVAVLLNTCTATRSGWMAATAAAAVLVPAAAASRSSCCSATSADRAAAVDPGRPAAGRDPARRPDRAAARRAYIPGGHPAVTVWLALVVLGGSA
jgi:hypothetical protein